MIAVAVVGLILVAGIAVYHYIPTETVCAISSLIGEYNVTAPSLLVNLPSGGGGGGNENGQNWTFASGSVVLGDRSEMAGGIGMGADGGSGGLVLNLQQPIFAIYAVHNVSSSMVAGALPCTQPYVAGTISDGFCGGGAFGGYPLANDSNDSVEPDVFNASCPYIPSGSGIISGAYMWIGNSFPENPTPTAVDTLDLCSWTSNFYQPVFGAVVLPVEIHAPFEGRTIVVEGYLWWASVGADLPTAYYYLTPGAIWRVASVGLYSEDTIGLLPPGLLAFEKSPCA